MSKNNQLIQIVEKAGLEKSKAEFILEQFSGYFKIASEWEKKAKTLIVTNEEQKDEMQLAREGRLFLKDKRVTIEKTRKGLKEQSLREGQTIDSIARILKNLIEPIEQHLLSQERFAAIQREKRAEILKAKREKALEPYAEFVPYGLALDGMSEDDFIKVLSGAKLQLQEKLNTEKKEEEKRVAQEKADAIEREKIRKDNERLQKEAKERERVIQLERKRAEKEKKLAGEKVRKEREAAEEKLRKESEAREKVEEELRKKREAEEQEASRVEVEKQAKIDADKKARAAPDKVKLTEFADLIDGLVFPGLKTKEAEDILNNVRKLLDKVSAYINEQATTL